MPIFTIAWKYPVITPFWRADIGEDAPMGSFCDLANTIGDVCTAYGNITVLDGSELVPNIPEYFRDKTLHPSDEGFLHIAINLAKKIDVK